jgi:hypothetical protein
MGQGWEKMEDAVRRLVGIMMHFRGKMKLTPGDTL